MLNKDSLLKQYLIPVVLIIMAIGMTAWMTSLGQVGLYFVAPPDKLLRATIVHIRLVVVAEILAILIGISLGYAISRPKLKFISPFIMGFVNMGQTIPTLAAIAILGIALGFGFLAGIIVLFLYATLPIVRNTYAAIISVDPSIKEAGRGMGMTLSQITFRVELSLSRPVIMAGIRTSTVINVGTAAVAGMVGAGGLGEVITMGIAVRHMELVIQGAALTAALAILIDSLLAGLESWMTPRGLKVAKTAAKV
jgi:osmoprotectant transport system permease protein